MQRSRRGAPSVSLSLLSDRSQDHQPRDDTVHKRLGPPHQSRIQKISYIRSSGRRFLYHGSKLLSDNSGCVRLTENEPAHRRNVFKTRSDSYLKTCSVTVASWWSQCGEGGVGKILAKLWLTVGHTCL